MARARTRAAAEMAPKPASAGERRYCAQPVVKPREFGPDVSANRLSLIRENEKKWVSGTVLHYHFFDKDTDGENVVFTDGSTEWRPWRTGKAEQDVVRRAFDVWKQIGIGIEFKEVSTRDEAEVRIGFMRDDGAWSYTGREILDIGRDKRTMNFGWDLTSHSSEIDTAVHEIGHTLGFPHEHQNPNSGIVWDEEAVYAALAKPPNNWSRAKTFYNIIRKIDPDTVQGSSWDPNSIMHYPFGPGLIREPAQYRTTGLSPAGGLSQRDKTWAKTFYPAIPAAEYAELRPCESVRLEIREGEQKNFVINPNATRRYEIQTFGESDTVIVLFEEDGQELRYLAGDDDSGQGYNARLALQLVKGRNYVLRLRLYYQERAGETAVMMW